MGSGFTDMFQLVIGVYLLYMGIRGENLESRLTGIEEKNEVEEPKALRGLYIVGGIFALADFGICMLRNSMFTVEQTEAGLSVTQNYTLSAFPFLTYDLMNTASRILSLLAIAALIGSFIWLFVLSSRHENKKIG